MRLPLPSFLHRLFFLCAALLALGLSAAPVQAQSSYVKVSNQGYALPASATLGSGPNDWACTYDSQTGLIWEVKTTSGLRSQNHTYTWYDSLQVPGEQGVQGSTATCENPSGPYENCNTENYVQAVNSVGLCGAGDWRMPARIELLWILDMGQSNPAIDPAWFPNTEPYRFWTGEPSSLPSGAWFVNFNNGGSNAYDKTSTYSVRLVRGGQPFTFLPTTTSIPTLSQWATLALAGLLGLTSLAAMRRRGQRG